MLLTGKGELRSKTARTPRSSDASLERRVPIHEGLPISDRGQVMRIASVKPGVPM